MKVFLGYLMVTFLIGVFFRRNRRLQFLAILAVALFAAFAYFFLKQI
ncbi:MAG: hypothetical protein HUU38_02250 [Anaerolineales bacterium]|jgi:biotin transporter BioY|nr:hypothetical protein [Anaerolineales bacterium]